jgi:hypothetical protein
MGPGKNGIWGPIFWKFLHEISFQFPQNPTDQEKKSHENFLLNLKYFIPCYTCKNDFQKYISQNPPILNSKKNFVKWTVDLHNHVNKKLGKREYSYEEVEEEWNANTEHCISCLNIRKEKEESSIKSINKYIKIAQIIFFLGFLIFMFLYLEKKYKIVQCIKSMQKNNKNIIKK